MSRKLIVINGTMGVGKSSVSTALKNSLENSIMLDGDWCWMMNPWKITDDNKRMLENNIVYMLLIRPKSTRHSGKRISDIFFFKKTHNHFRASL